MKSIQVFDPALCCSSGVCGTDVDQALVNFAADVDWARQQGVQVERFNLAQQPMAFAQAAEVKAALERSGEAALPLTVMDGQVKLSGRYPLRDELKQWLDLGAAAPKVGAKLAAIAVAAAPTSSCCSPAPAPATSCCSPAPATAGASKCS